MDALKDGVKTGVRAEIREPADTVRNKIDLSLPPEALFLNPWLDEGLCVLRQPDFIWRPRAAGRIEGFLASTYPAIGRKIRTHLRDVRQSKRFAQAIEYAAVPAVLENASFRKSYVMAEDRFVLSGAVGTRLINRYLWDNRGGEVKAQSVLQEYFAEQQSGEAQATLAVNSALLETEIDFAVPCRNTFNYYHFITESLAQLTVLDGLDFHGNIYFHYPNADEKQQPFALAFAEALFPEFAGRMFFERAPKDYERVLTCFDMSGAHCQMPQHVTRGMEQLAPKAFSDAEKINEVGARNTLSMNSVSSVLPALRDRALRLIEGRSVDHLPKRFFVGRDTRKSRSRHMAGEDLLFEHLALFGFEYVVFENLSPLDQIALMANAEMMVSYHGAGFTNMLFANPDAYVIEIGTLQTAQHRWGDFWPLAHTAQCRYINFFADFNTEKPALEPNFDKDGIVPVALSEKATAQVMAFVVTVLGHVPELTTLGPLRDLATEVYQAGAADKAIALIETHADLMRYDCDLNILKADCHKEMGEPKSELLALDMAYKADPSRWRTLIRIIWCAKACDRPQVIRWALSRLQIEFPDRHDAFLGNHEWVRYVA